jgi:hypothetical protein
MQHLSISSTRALISLSCISPPSIDSNELFGDMIFISTFAVTPQEAVPLSRPMLSEALRTPSLSLQRIGLGMRSAFATGPNREGG